MSGASAGPGRRLRPDIQGLRALAVVMVIANHFAGRPAGGFVGVDVFFVISGYLITGILLREGERDGHVSLRGFYARRVRRILPVALLVIGTTVLATRVLAGADRYHSTARDGIFAVGFLANWHFASTGVNYFAQSLPPSPLQHLWSLSVEEQFYLLWPALVIAVGFGGFRRRSRPAQPGSSAIRRRALAALLLLLSGASFAWALHQSATNPTVAYFSTFTRAWELGVGALLAVLGGHLDRLSSGQRTWLAWLGLMAILVSMVLIGPHSRFPAPWGLLPVLGTAAVLGCGADSDPRALSVLTNPVSEYLGTISYSLYLWHFPVTVLILTLLPHGSVGYWLVGPPLMLALAVASFHLLEDPARRGTWFRPRAHGLAVPSRGWLRYAGACVMIAIVALLADLGVRAITPRALAFSPALAQTAAADPQSCLGAAALDPRHLCPQLDRGNRVAPLPGELADDTAGAYACYAYAGQPLHPCVYGSRRPDAIRVALVGDSHAAALLAALAPQLGRLNWRLTAMTGNSCRWLPARDSPACPGLARMQSALLRDHFQVVISTELRLATNPVSEHLAVMAPVADTGARIVIVEDDPGVSAAATACVQRISFRPTGHCGTPVALAYAAPDRLVAAARRIPGAIVIPTRRYFCRAGFCPQTIGNVIVYRDAAAHVSADYAETLGPYLAVALRRALGPALS